MTIEDSHILNLLQSSSVDPTLPPINQLFRIHKGHTVIKEFLASEQDRVFSTQETASSNGGDVAKMP